MKMTRTEGDMNLQLGFLMADALTVSIGARMAVAVGVGALKAYVLLYPERSKIIDLHKDIDVLTTQLNTVCPRYAK